jgi:hypothetical protein
VIAQSIEPPPAYRAGAEGEEMTFVLWSPAEDERLRELALSGESLAEIAVQMQRNKSSVRTRALKLEVAIARDRNPMLKGKTSAHRVGLRRRAATAEPRDT